MASTRSRNGGFDWNGSPRGDWLLNPNDGIIVPESSTSRSAFRGAYGPTPESLAIHSSHIMRAAPSPLVEHGRYTGRNRESQIATRYDRFAPTVQCQQLALSSLDATIYLVRIQDGI